MIEDLWEGTGLGPGPERAAPRSTWVPDNLPEDLDAERTVLATCCAPGALREAVKASSELEPEDFVHPSYAGVFRAMRELVKAGTEINAFTIKDTLDRNGDLGRIGGYPGLIELLAWDDVGDVSTVIRIVKEKSRLRRLIKEASKVILEAQGGKDCTQIISAASEALTRIAIDSPQKELVADLSDLLDDLAEGRPLTTQNGGKALSWGDTILDDLCPIPRGEPTLVTARPGVGKSGMAVQILCASVAAGIAKPLFLSLEMGREKIKARVAAYLSRVNSRVFRDAHYGPSEIQKIIEAQHILKGIKTMFPKQQCSVEEIEALVVYAIERYGIDSVILDQFSHVAEPRDAKKENYAIKNAAISKRLTALAKNHNLGWVTLAQINKDGEDNRRPTMRDLAATDRLAQDAAVIFGMWNKGTDEKQEVWGTLIKTRDEGQKGWAKQLATDYGTCTFRVMERETFGSRF